MIQYLNVFFYDIYPYICATVFFLGSWLRYDYGQYTWRASSSQMLDKRGMVIWSNLFHILRHSSPAPPINVNTPQIPPSTIAISCFAATGKNHAYIQCGVNMPNRCPKKIPKIRLTNQRVRATSTTPDIIIMSILLIQCLLGLSTIPFSAQYPDGSEMMKLVGWAQSIVTFRGGSSEMLNGVAFVFRLHLVLGMTIFLLFPFTRLVHVWSAPFEYFTRRYQIVRSRR
ncbi:TPA: respiratory nitrate reductase subunit gamma [Escherichia coli]